MIQVITSVFSPINEKENSTSANKVIYKKTDNKVGKANYDIDHFTAVDLNGISKLLIGQESPMDENVWRKEVTFHLKL